MQKMARSLHQVVQTKVLSSGPLSWKGY